MRLPWQSCTVNNREIVWHDLKRHRSHYSSTIALSGFDWDLGTLGAFALINKEKKYGTLTYCMG